MTSPQHPLWLLTAVREIDGRPNRLVTTGSGVPLSIERLARQVRRVDAEYATLKRRLSDTADEAAADRVQRRMADLKNRRVTLAGEIAEWLATAPTAQRALVHALLTPPEP